MLSRREFLGRVGAAGIVSIGSLPPAFLTKAAWAAQDAGSKGDRILLLVQLSGGNDGLNTVVPFGDSLYYKNRPGVGIPEGAVLKLDKYHGQHPRMQGFKELFDEGMLGIVQGVGYPQPDRSHFRSMDIWHSARPETVSVQDGWLGRAFDVLADRQAGQIPALCLGEQRLPLALLSSKVTVPVIQNADQYRLKLGGGPERDQTFRRELIHQFAQQTSEGSPNLEFLRRTAETAYVSAAKLEELAKTYKPAVSYPNNQFGEKLKVIAQIVASDIGVNVFFVSLDGFDTHSAQEQAHAILLGELSDGLRAFYSDLKEHGFAERVLTATYSEFGRRVKENGSLGTDHGAASQMFLVSQKIKGGLLGKHPSLSDLEDGDLKFHTDFRSVYATLLERWLDCPSNRVLGKSFPILDFI